MVLVCSFSSLITVPVGGPSHLSALVHKILQNHYRDRPMTTRGRNQAPVRSPRNNGYAMIPSPENNFPDRNSHDLSQAQMPLQKGGGKFGFPDSPTSSPRMKAYPNANGSIHPYDRVTEFGPVEHVPLEAPPSGRQTNSGSSSSQNSSVGQASTNSELSTDQDRYRQIHWLTRFYLFIANSDMTV